MFQNLESHATSIHESTSQIVDSLIEFILRSYYALEQYGSVKAQTCVN